MTYVALVSYHTNPYTCGVARFNTYLASALNTRVIALSDYLDQLPNSRVLLSIKLEEMTEQSIRILTDHLVISNLEFDLFLHGTVGSVAESTLMAHAGRVFAGNAQIAAKLRSKTSKALSVFAPGAPVVEELKVVDCTVLTFGMAHKIRGSSYQRLAELTAADERSFRLEISTALHEGEAFDESFFSISREITDLFRGEVHFLGFLSDVEVSIRLRKATALAAFFPQGVRENNTTVLSAMAHGCPVITNCDEWTPSWMAHGRTVFDVRRLRSMPSSADLRRVGNQARYEVSSRTFADLARIILDSPAEGNTA